MADPVAFLEAALARAEELARALPPGPWRWVKAEDDEYESLVGADGVYVLSSSDAEQYQSWIDKDPAFDAYLPLIDSAAVLRRVKADRAILADHVDDDGDCQVCCDAGLTEYVHDYGVVENRSALPFPCRTVRLLAEAWGWEETT